MGNSIPSSYRQAKSFLTGAHETAGEAIEWAGAQTQKIQLANLSVQNTEQHNGLKEEYEPASKRQQQARLQLLPWRGRRKNSWPMNTFSRRMEECR
eukprot:6490301-Amphidinium_carterae.3